MTQLQNQQKPTSPVDAILSHPKPFELVQSMPSADLVFLLKSNGLPESLDVINFISPTQSKEILDLDCWQGHDLDTKACGTWLNAFFKASPQKSVSNFKNLDIELISLLFLNHTDIYELDEDTEFPDIPDNALHSQTPDRLYLLVFKQEEANSELIHFLKSAIDMLMGQDMRYVHRLIESVRWESPSLLAEDAHRWKEARMQDLGFPPLDEAKAIFAYTPVKNIKINHIKTNTTNPNKPNSSALIKTNTNFLNDYPILKNALANLPADTQSQKLEQIVLAVNHIHYAQNGRMGDVVALQACTKYALHYMEMGLIYLQKSNQDFNYSDILNSLEPKKLFQAGRSLVLKMSLDFKRSLQVLNTKIDSQKFQTPEREVLLGALQKEPMFFTGLLDANKKTFRPFQNFEEVLTTSKMLADIITSTKSV